MSTPPAPIRRGPLVHGTREGYRTHGCRCEACTAANTRAAKTYLVRVSRDGRMWVPAAGTRRRLEALAYLGWSQGWVAQRLGIGQQSVAKYGKARDSNQVHVDTANAIRRLYDEVGLTIGPYVKSRNWARSKGWLGPLAWDDDTIDDPTARPILGERDDELDHIAVQRLIDGRPVTATEAEKREAVARMAALELTDAEIGLRLHVSDRTVLRWRQAEGIESRWTA